MGGRTPLRLLVLHLADHDLLHRQHRLGRRARPVPLDDGPVGRSHVSERASEGDRTGPRRGSTHPLTSQNECPHENLLRSTSACESKPVMYSAAAMASAHVSLYAAGRSTSQPLASGSRGWTSETKGQARTLAVVDRVRCDQVRHCARLESACPLFGGGGVRGSPGRTYPLVRRPDLVERDLVQSCPRALDDSDSCRGDNVLVGGRDDVLALWAVDEGADSSAGSAEG